MGGSILNDPLMSFLKRGMDVSLKRQNVLNSNLANIDTPGYTPKDVKFKEALKGSMKENIGMEGTSDSHFEPATPPDDIATYERPDEAPGPDGNSVNLDTQMGRTAQNSQLYQATTRVMSKKLATLKYVISNSS